MPEPPGGGKKLFGLPSWAVYVGAGGLVLVVYVFYRNRQKAKDTSAQATQMGAAAAGAYGAPLPGSGMLAPILINPGTPNVTVTNNIPADVDRAPPKHMPPLPHITPPPAPPAMSAPPKPRTFTVTKWPNPGSSLYSIAGLVYGNPNAWPRLLGANPGKIANPNPALNAPGSYNVIQPGEVLNIP